MANSRVFLAGLCLVLSAAILVYPSRAVTAAPNSAQPKLVDKDAQESIDKGLKYLANTQRPDGQWYPSGSYGTYPTVMTSLAGLALMAGGSTPESGPYAKNVRRAMHYILRVAEAEKDGLIAGA
ncbi:MAG: hypothetical protein EHM48_04405, partial [Planctomycetaceae bacterium]